MNENPRDREMWTEAFRGKFEGEKPFQREDWDQLLGHCMVRFPLSTNLIITS